VTSWSIKRIGLAWLLGSLATVALMATFTGLALQNRGWLGYLRLVKGGAATNGVVLRMDRDNHCLAEYRFVVDGAEYGGAGPDCSLRAGEAVVVTYLISNPAHSCLGVARDGLNNELATFMAGALLLPPLAMYALRRRAQAQEGRAAQQGDAPDKAVL
jgi:hypothetical protein